MGAAHSKCWSKFTFQQEPCQKAEKNMFFCVVLTKFSGFLYFSTFFMQKTWKSIFWPVFWAHSPQTLVKIYNPDFQRKEHINEKIFYCFFITKETLFIRPQNIAMKVIACFYHFSWQDKWETWFLCASYLFILHVLETISYFTLRKKWQLSYDHNLKFFFCSGYIVIWNWRFFSLKNVIEFSFQ